MMESVEEIYAQTANLIPTERPIHLLDLGCCTELEYDMFIQVNPSVEVTGVDQEEHLTKMLEKKSGKRIERLRLIYGDYLEVDFGKCHYDIAISKIEVNELDRKQRLKLYKKIFGALEDDGCYIERDYIGNQASEDENLSNMFSKNVSLLLESGFQRVEKAWYNNSTIILRAMK